MTDPLLSVTDLRTYFATDAGVVRAVDGMDFDVRSGEVVGLVGESGAGKTVAARSILRLVDEPGRIVGGEVRFRDRPLVGFDDAPAAGDLPADGLDSTAAVGSVPDPDPRADVLSEAAMREEIRGTEIATIFQDPTESLNPVRSVGAQLREVIAANRDLQGSEARAEAVGLLREVGIPDAASRYDAYPHQLSGGMCQRVVIAMALGCRPSLIVADEPTTALDPTVEGQILDLVRERQADRDTSVLWITHDMGVVAELCDRVAVAYAGEIVEVAPVDDLFHDSSHPYTEALLAATPRPGDPRDRLDPIDGSMPDAVDLPRGCRFHPRCPHAREVCTEVNPDCRPVADGEGASADRARAGGGGGDGGGSCDGGGGGSGDGGGGRDGGDAHRVACLRDDAFAEVDYDGSPSLGDATTGSRGEPGASVGDPGGDRGE